MLPYISNYENLNEEETSIHNKVKRKIFMQLISFVMIAIYVFAMIEYKRINQGW